MFVIDKMFFKTKKIDKGINHHSNSMIKSENKIMPRMFEWFKKDKDNCDKCDDSKNIFSGIFNKTLFKKNSDSQHVCSPSVLSLKKFETTDIKSLTQKTVWEERIEIKYIANDSAMESLLQKLSAEYLLLEHNGKCVSHYTTEYLDTADRSIFYGNRNQNNKPRYKIRKRYYNNEDHFWLEVKEKKNGKLRKYRIFNPTPCEFEKFICSNTPYAPSDLKSALFVYHDRMTFMHKTLPLKITVDTNLKVKKDGSGCMIPFNNIMIIELKSRKNEVAYAARIIESQDIKPRSVSKYRIGMAIMHPELKSDDKLKPTLLQIKKINKNIKICKI